MKTWKNKKNEWVQSMWLHRNDVYSWEWGKKKTSRRRFPPTPPPHVRHWWTILRSIMLNRYFYVARARFICSQWWRTDKLLVHVCDYMNSFYSYVARAQFIWPYVRHTYLMLLYCRLSSMHRNGSSPRCACAAILYDLNWL
jgi:hypothetical protein